MACEPTSVVLPTYITPVLCPDCGGDAHLTRRTPTSDLKGEVRSFACAACGKQVETTIRD